MSRDMLQSGLAWMHRQRAANMAAAAVFVRLEDETETDIADATVVQARYERPDANGMPVEVRIVDFIFGAAVLGFEPAEGDIIRYDGRDYEATPLGGDPCWRHTDASRLAIRVHTRDFGETEA